MPRLQILELPEGVDDERPPFVLVIDQYVPQRVILGHGQTGETREPSDPMLDQLRQAGQQIGARGVLLFEETVEIPANEVPIGPDGYPVKMRVEADFGTFHEQAAEEIARIQEKVAEWRTPPPEQQQPDRSCPHGSSSTARTSAT
ncbi:hypothetical protein [Streptomyces chumphonensis]|uniref:hypothetical protein n=1 Tax=Streptomyces chumphonensis TaxID=1214925 RepID=UPI003D704345